MKTKRYLPGAYFLCVMAMIPALYAAPFVKKDLIMVDDLFIKTKPQCAGIYIVDVPESFDNSTHTATYDDFKIESQFMYPPAFEKRIKLREQELHKAINRPGNELDNAPFIKEIIRLPGNEGVIFDRNISNRDDLNRVLEAHVYLSKIAFIITVEILDLSNKKYSERKNKYINSGFTEVEMNDKPTKLVVMRSLISRLNGRLNHDIPTQKGVCIPNGFIADDGRSHKVVIGFSYDSEDFQFDINTNNKYDADGDTLFGRSAAINEGLNSSGMETLKKEARIVNGISTETWFFKGLQTYDKKHLQVYDFLLYGNEAVASKSKPLIKLEIDSQYKQTRYSEAQMVEIWDRIVGSLRYKPNAF